MVSVSATVREDSGTITAGHGEGNFHSNYIIQLWTSLTDITDVITDTNIVKCYVITSIRNGTRRNFYLFIGILMITHLKYFNHE